METGTTERDSGEPSQEAPEPRQRQAGPATTGAANAIEDLLRARITDLEEQNRHLWEERAQMNATLQRQTAIIEHLVALPAMAGPSTTPAPAAATPAEAPRLSWWQRLFGGK